MVHYRDHYQLLCCPVLRRTQVICIISIYIYYIDNGTGYIKGRALFNIYDLAAVCTPLDIVTQAKFNWTCITDNAKRFISQDIARWRTAPYITGVCRGILGPACHAIKSLQLIWRSSTRRFHLSSNELNWLELKMGYQVCSCRNGRQGDMPYWFRLCCT